MDGWPIISAWDYSSGKVVTITTDNGNEWGSQLFIGENLGQMYSIIEGTARKGTSPILSNSYNPENNQQISISKIFDYIPYKVFSWNLILLIFICILIITIIFKYRMSIFFKRKIKVVRHYTIKQPVGQTYSNGGTIPVGPKSTIIKPAALIDTTVEMIDLGWEKSGKNFYGYFSDNSIEYEGRIEWDTKEGIYKPYIRTPPKDVHIGPHSRCFNLQPDGSYWIHLNNPSSDPVETLRTVEYVIKNPLRR